MIVERVGKRVPFSSQNATFTLSCTFEHTSTVFVSLSYEIEWTKTFPSIFTCWKMRLLILREVSCMWAGVMTHREVEIGSISCQCHLHSYHLSLQGSKHCPAATEFSLESNCTITGGDQQFYDNWILTLADLK